jgi:hypothetical protein
VRAQVEALTAQFRTAAGISIPATSHLCIAQ